MKRHLRTSFLGITGLIAATVLLLASLTSPKAHAGVNDFVINDFSTDYTLTNKDKQGELRIVEDIDLTFSDFNHGIERAIPKTYKDNSLKVKVNGISSSTGAPTDLSTRNESGNLVLRIGSPSRTITGHQTYKIDNTVQNVIGFYGNHDE